MRPFLLGFARLVAVGMLISVLLYGLERLMGWSELQSISGALLCVIGIFIAFGTSSGSHWASKAQATGITERDIRLFRSDTRQRFGSGTSLIVIGAVVFVIAVLLP